MEYSACFLSNLFSVRYVKKHGVIPISFKYSVYLAKETFLNRISLPCSLLFITLQFDYVIFTGDIPAHNVWNQTRSEQLSAMDVLTKYLKTYLPDKIVYNTLGNHESAPVNR